MDCPLCERENYYPSDHHLIPKSRGGTYDDVMCICESCHQAIHKLFSNKELESIYNNVDALLTHEKFAKTLAFIKKQNPQTKIKTERSRERQGRRP
jgi:hypothetical protein